MGRAAHAPAVPEGSVEETADLIFLEHAAFSRHLGLSGGHQTSRVRGDHPQGDGLVEQQAQLGQVVGEGPGGVAGLPQLVQARTDLVGRQVGEARHVRLEPRDDLASHGDGIAMALEVLAVSATFARAKRVVHEGPQQVLVPRLGGLERRETVVLDDGIVAGECHGRLRFGEPPLGDPRVDLRTGGELPLGGQLELRELRGQEACVFLRTGVRGALHGGGLEVKGVANAPAVPWREPGHVGHLAASYTGRSMGHSEGLQGTGCNPPCNPWLRVTGGVFGVLRGVTGRYGYRGMLRREGA